MRPGCSSVSNIRFSNSIRGTSDETSKCSSSVCAPWPSTPRQSRVATRAAVKLPSLPPPVKVSIRSMPSSAANARACSNSAAMAFDLRYGGRLTPPETSSLIAGL
ncbi:MAG: hypothetical protein V3R90_12425 [Limibaculum sp.]